MSTAKGREAPVYVDVFARRDVMASTKLVAERIWFYQSLRDGWCWASNAKLASACGIDDRSVTRAVKQFSEQAR